jgi:hypothetical protein
LLLSVQLTKSRGAEDGHAKPCFAHFSGEHFKALKPYLGDNKTYSEIRYISGPNMSDQILFVLLESTHFKAPNGSENGL